jgi:phage shock protein PspC (stress-responsive transcriptional regulator)
MKDFLKKLTSRKLWLAIAGVATGIAIAFGADAGEISTVAGAVLSVISVVTYIVTEGKVDAEGVKNAIIAIDGVTDLLGEDEDV